MTFLEAVNRVLRESGIIRGDTDTVSTFNDTAHNATLNLAIVAIQNELGDLIADRMIPYELGASTITLVANTRTYSLASDFIRFYGDAFFKTTGNFEISEYVGGRPALQSEIPNYKTSSGSPISWYWEPGPTKQVGFYQVPSGTDTLTYDYEKSVMVSASTDTIPLHNTEEANQFCTMASRRFKVLYEDADKLSDIVAVLDNDQTYKRSKRNLLHMIKGQNPPNSYATRIQ